jgi:hypothetical protein
MSQSSAELTDALRGFTTLARLEFSVEAGTGIGTLILDLVENKTDRPRAIRAEFAGVATLSIKDFGGGLTQLLLLSIRDISDKQLDGISYEVRELERGSIMFVCRTAKIAPLDGHQD